MMVQGSVRDAPRARPSGVCSGAVMVAAAVWAALVQCAIAAEPYPSRTVEIIVPFSAGGGTDLLARLLAEGLTKRLGQPFVVLNRPGGNTNVGTQAAVKAAPDGHTLIMASVGLTANPSLYKRLPFEP